MRNIINTLGMSIVIGFVIAMYMACIEGWGFGGLSIGYTLMGALFPYEFHNQLVSLGITIITIACACTPRTYTPCTQTRAHKKYIAKQTYVPPIEIRDTQVAPTIDGYTIEFVGTHPVLPLDS